MRPKLAASQGLYALGQQLLHVEGREDAQEWIGAYQAWCARWKDGRVQLSVYPSFCLKGLMHDE